MGHPGHPHRADESAVVMQVGLDDVEPSVGDHPAEPVLARLLLTSGDRDAQGVGDGLGIFEMVEAARLLVERIVVFLHEPADRDGLRDVVRAVRVGVERHLLAERLADHRDQPLGPTGPRVGVLAHPAAEAKLQRPGAGLGDELLQVGDLLFGCVAPNTTGAVHGDLAAMDPAQQLADELAGDLSQQVQDRDLGGGHADPERQALILVVVVVAIELPEQGLELSGVLAHEEGRDPVEEDRVGVDHVHRVRDAEALGAVVGPDPHDEVAPVAKQLDRGDPDRPVEAVDGQDGGLGGGTDPLLERAGILVIRAACRGRRDDRRAQSGREESPTCALHDRVPWYGR